MLTAPTRLPYLSELSVAACCALAGETVTIIAEPPSSEFMKCSCCTIVRLISGPSPYHYFWRQQVRIDLAAFLALLKRLLRYAQLNAFLLVILGASQVHKHHFRAKTGRTTRSEHSVNMFFCSPGSSLKQDLLGLRRIHAFLIELLVRVRCLPTIARADEVFRLLLDAHVGHPLPKGH